MRLPSWLLLLVPLLALPFSLPSAVNIPSLRSSSLPNYSTLTTLHQSKNQQPDDDDITPQEALARLFSGEALQEEWFAPNFISQISIDRVDAVIDETLRMLGKFEGVEGERSPFILVFELGTVPAEISMGRNGQIIGLFFYPSTLSTTTIEDVIKLARDLPGEVSLLVTKNGKEVASIKADEPLAVGSAFKLAVLSVLKDKIEAGEHNWDDVRSLQSAWKNLPTGILQNWPKDSPLTLHTLATLMISLSDNTAADALIDLVGRETLEAISPHNHPFLTVSELTKLKATPNINLLTRYRSSNEANKRKLLETLAAMPLPSPEELSTTPIVDIEWFFAAEELCELMADVETLDLMTVDPGPGVIPSQTWTRIVYKGGSELGVLNLTTWLETEAGDTYCVTMTQNQPHSIIDEPHFVTIYRSLISVLE